MKDYLDPASRPLRLLCGIAAALAALLLLAGSAIIWIDMLRKWEFTFNGKPTWIGAIFLGVLGFASAFISRRLLARADAPNGLTALPLWFIQWFGVFLLLGMIVLAVVERDPIAIEGTFVALAMIFVGRNIAKRLKNKPIRDRSA